MPSALLLLLSASLSYSAPEACPSSDEFAGRYRALTGSDGPLPEAQVSIQRREGRFEASVLAGGVERTLEADDCETLADAAALVLSLVDRPQRRVRVGQATATPRVEAEVVTHVWLGLGGGALFGLQGDPAVRGTVTVSVQRERWSGALTVSAGPGSLHLGTPREDSGAFVAVPVTGLLTGCWRAWEATVQVSGCVGLHGGALLANGVALSRVDRGAAAWLGVELLAAVEVPLTSALHVRLDGGGGLNLIRPRVETTTDLLFQPGWGLAQASLSLVVRVR